jgi:hypothetical protein
MLALGGINALAILLFASAYGLAAARLLSQGAFLAALIVLFGAFTALWVRTERRSTRSGDFLSRVGRIGVGYLIAAIAVPGLVLMPLFSLREQLPEEAGVDVVLPGVMVILLASLALGALTNVAGIAFMLGQGLFRRLRGR